MQAIAAKWGGRGMSTWKIAGQSADLTKSIEELVRDLLFAQWNITNPAKGTTATAPGSPEKVLFGLGWFGGVKSIYEIHCQHVTTTASPISNGWNYRQYTTTVNVHTFVRRVGTSEPSTLLNMQNEVERILSQKKNDLGQGVKPMKFTGWGNADDPEDIGTISYWHRVGTVEVTYFKVDTSP